jgi:zinc transport system substrate-binding protein
MRKKVFVLIIFVILGFLIVLIYRFSSLTRFLPKSDELKNETKLKVAATIFPLYDITRQIAGEKAQVLLIAPAGASPHTFEVSPGDIKKLQGTKVIFAIGYGLDNWITKIGEAIEGVDIKEVAKGIELRKYENHGDELSGDNESQAGNIDPHYWLTIPNAKIIAHNISQVLKTIDSQNAFYYQENEEKYLNDLEKTDKEMRELIGKIKPENRRFMTLHDAWSYFAKEYGLELVGTFEPFPGKEPTPQYLASLAKKAKEKGIKVIFSEPQLSNQTLIPFLNDLKIGLFILDPIGGLEERDSYLRLMLYNAKTFYDALR